MLRISRRKGATHNHHVTANMLLNQSQKFVKIVYKVKCSVIEKVETIKVKNVVFPDKGQFYKYAGPNQVWVPKKV